MNDVVQFSISLRASDDGAPRWLWTVVCDRCGVELDVDASELTVMKIRGLSEMQAVDPAGTITMVRRLREAYDLAVAARRPMIVDAEDIEVQKHPGGIERVIEHHAATCKAAT